MTQKQYHNLLSKTLKWRFGEKSYRLHFTFERPEQLGCEFQENHLLLRFAPKSGDFFEQACFQPYRDSAKFIPFRGAFFLSTLPLILKLALLETLLKHAHIVGDKAFVPWTKFFTSTYHRSFISRRNMEWDSLFFIHQYRNTQLKTSTH